MQKNFLLVVVVLISWLLSGCSGGPGNPDNPPNGSDPDGYPSELVQPEDLVYQGAFRLPGGSNGTDWNYSGAAAAYYPEGDPAGPMDGCPGSIFAVGHDWHMYVSEISIPLPVNSPAKNVNDLNTARTLQAFRDVRSEVGSLGVLREIIRVGMEYLPKQGQQTRDKLYLCWGQHLQEDEQRVASHMWCDLDLGNSRGAWWVGSQSLYSVNDYMFEIPRAWADKHTPGKLLATGRFRDGGWSGQGPALFAIGPWNHGNPPLPGTVLEEVTLQLYSSSYYEDEGNFKMDNYHHSDEWSGGAWLTAGNKTAVIFVGTKGAGDCWYGDANGPCLECEGERGWWSTSFKGQVIFYDPADLAAVADGTRQPYQPQPYAALDIDPYLYNVRSSQQKGHVRAVCFDRARGLLYIFEFRADRDKCLVHAWKIS